MQEKHKTICLIITSALSFVWFTVVLFLLCRGKAYGRGSSGAVSESSGSTERLADTIRATETATAENLSRIRNCQERLQRAEEILRGAIERSRKEKETNLAGDSDK